MKLSRKWMDSHLYKIKFFPLSALLSVPYLAVGQSLPPLCRPGSLRALFCSTLEILIGLGHLHFEHSLNPIFEYHSFELTFI